MWSASSSAMAAIVAASQESSESSREWEEKTPERRRLTVEKRRCAEAKCEDRMKERARATACFKHKTLEASSDLESANHSNA